MVIGSIDELTPYYISGWASYDIDSYDKVPLQFFLNNELIAEGLASNYRQDLFNKKIGQGHCAFKAHFTKKITLDDIQDIKNFSIRSKDEAVELLNFRRVYYELVAILTIETNVKSQPKPVVAFVTEGSYLEHFGKIDVILQEKYQITVVKFITTKNPQLSFFHELGYSFMPTDCLRHLSAYVDYFIVSNIPPVFLPSDAKILNIHHDLFEYNSDSGGKDYFANYVYTDSQVDQATSIFSKIKLSEFRFGKSLIRKVPSCALEEYSKSSDYTPKHSILLAPTANLCMSNQLMVPDNITPVIDVLTNIDFIEKIYLQLHPASYWKHQSKLQKIISSASDHSQIVVLTKPEDKIVAWNSCFLMITDISGLALQFYHSVKQPFICLVKSLQSVFDYANDLMDNDTSWGSSVFFRNFLFNGFILNDLKLLESYCRFCYLNRDFFNETITGYTRSLFKDSSNASCAIAQDISNLISCVENTRAKNPDFRLDLANLNRL